MPVPFQNVVAFADLRQESASFGLQSVFMAALTLYYEKKNYYFDRGVV